MQGSLRPTALQMKRHGVGETGPAGAGQGSKRRWWRGAGNLWGEVKVQCPGSKGSHTESRILACWVVRL